MIIYPIAYVIVVFQLFSIHESEDLCFVCWCNSGGHNTKINIHSMRKFLAISLAIKRKTPPTHPEKYSVILKIIKCFRSVKLLAFYITWILFFRRQESFLEYRPKLMWPFIWLSWMKSFGFWQCQRIIFSPCNILSSNIKVVFLSFKN